jgi:three-Cys-motif partner protein
LYLRTLLPTIQYRLFNRALCVLDPYGLHLDWDIIELAGKFGAVDLFLNFPVMEMNRNAIWRNPEKTPQDGIDRMNRFWGDESWKSPPMQRANSALFPSSRQTTRSNRTAR